MAYITGSRTMHRTKEGQIMPINTMEDKHLINTINLFITKLDDAKWVLEENDSAFYRAVNGIEMDKSGAKNYANNFVEVVSPYITEAVIRGLNLVEQRENMQNLLGREGRVKEPTTSFIVDSRGNYDRYACETTVADVDDDEDLTPGGSPIHW